MFGKEITNQIIDHYDIVSPFYQELWDNHIHHGYYLKGNEPNQIATQNLIKMLYKKSKISEGSTVLDIGCGIGATSIWLAKEHKCKVTGITISPIQIEMAKALAKKSKLTSNPKFFVSDANKLPTTKKYDVLWSVEMISHLWNREEFFKRCTKILKPEGKFVIADWFKDADLNSAQLKSYIRPIEKGMLVSLWTQKQYIDALKEGGLKLIYNKDISQNVKRTWDVSLKTIDKKKLWKLAIGHSKETVDFLRAFSYMKKGFDSGAFRYCVMVFEK
jgi:tocopherol O-methyltransferase